MPKFNFEVEVSGAIEGWDLALRIQDYVNGSKGSREDDIHVERVEEFHPETIEDAYDRGFQEGENSTSGEWQEGYDEGYEVGKSEAEAAAEEKDE